MRIEKSEEKSTHQRLVGISPSSAGQLYGYLLNIPKYIYQIFQLRSVFVNANIVCFVSRCTLKNDYFSS